MSRNVGHCECAEGESRNEENSEDDIDIREASNQ